MTLMILLLHVTKFPKTDVYSFKRKCLVIAIFGKTEQKDGSGVGSWGMGAANMLPGGKYMWCTVAVRSGCVMAPSCVC